jgi:hypothetical protein
MNDFNITTPAVLFPAISLLLLAYTNRFLAIANLIRSLKEKFLQNPTDSILLQIRNLRRRVYIIRNMQWFGAFSLFLCVISMFFVFEHRIETAQHVFSLGVLSLSISLALSLREIHLSVVALNIDLKSIEEQLGNETKRLPLDFFS